MAVLGIVLVEILCSLLATHEILSKACKLLIISESASAAVFRRSRLERLQLNVIL